MFWAAESLGLSSMVCYTPALMYGRGVEDSFEKFKKSVFNEKEEKLQKKEET